MRQSDNHTLLIAGLDDAYGPYGKVGLALLECSNQVWTIKLLLTYTFAGFQEIERVGDLSVSENDLSSIQPFPDYVKVQPELPL